MTLRHSLTFILVLVATCTGVMGREFIDSPIIKHWLRALDVPTDCVGQTKGTKVPDTSDCHNFYICDGEGNMRPEPITCPEKNDCFDSSNTGDCSSVEADCKASCLATESSCKTKCENEGDLLADMTNCRRFKICHGAIADDLDPIDFYCIDDERPHFNGNKCVSDKAQCCYCQVGTCTSELLGDLLPDPHDCHAFYACLELDSNATLVGPIKCDDGGSFANGDCDASNPNCENICDTGTVTRISDTSTSSVSSTATTTPSSGSSTSTTTPSSGTSVSTTTSIATPTTTPGCMDLFEFTCNGNGFYTRCPYCDPSYFSCNENEPKIGYCAGEYVFNPDPASPYCMRPENCPFHPQPFNQ